MSAIAKIYAKKVASGERTIDSVPDTVLAEVKEILGIVDETAETEESSEEESEETESEDSEETESNVEDGTVEAVG